jgi:hypothetical protein
MSVVETFLSKHKDSAGTIQSYVTIVAIVIGAAWTYRLFVENRQQAPHLNISHAVVSKHLTNNVVWVHLTVYIENTGDNLVSLREGDIRLQQILPLHASLLGPLARGEDLVEKPEDLISWPPLCRYLPKLDLDIEPKEKDILEYDFLVPRSLRTIRLYSYFKNERYSYGTHELGWHSSTIYEIQVEKELEENKTAPNTDRIPACRIDQ